MAAGTLSLVSSAEQAHTLTTARTMGLVVFPLLAPGSWQAILLPQKC
jgi:hypothetical protein